jgi:hypothetical protein
LVWKITEAEKRLDELRGRLEKDKENLGASYRGFKEAAEMYQRKEITASEYAPKFARMLGVTVVTLHDCINFILETERCLKELSGILEKE